MIILHNIYMAGVKAAMRNQPRSSSLCPVCIDAIKEGAGQPIGYSIPISAEWLRGYQSVRDAEAEKILES